MERRKFCCERIIRNNEKEIWNRWKKRRLKSENIGKIWKKIVKRYEKELNSEMIL
jgi:thymidylate synthase